jgi:hypothetical protein
MDRAQDQKIDLWIIMSVAWNPEKIIELSLFLSTWNVLAPKILSSKTCSVNIQFLGRKPQLYRTSSNSTAQQSNKLGIDF